MALTVPMQSSTKVRPLTFTFDSGALPIRVRAEASTAFSSELSGSAICSGVRYDCLASGRCGAALQEESSENAPLTVAQPERVTAKTLTRMPTAALGRGA